MKMNARINKQVINLKALSAQPIKPVQIKVKPTKKSPKKTKPAKEKDEYDEIFGMDDDDLDDILG